MSDELVRRAHRQADNDNVVHEGRVILLHPEDLLACTKHYGATVYHDPSQPRGQAKVIGKKVVTTNYCQVVDLNDPALVGDFLPRRKNRG